MTRRVPVSLLCLAVLTQGALLAQRRAASSSRPAPPASSEEAPQPASAPPIAIERPAEGAYLRTPSAAVRVGASDAILSLSVNGIAAAHDRDGVFVAEAVPLSEGPVTLIARAVGRDGHTFTASVNVIADRTPPRLTVSEGGVPFVSGALLRRGARPIIGADDRSPVVVNASLNGKPFVSGSEVAQEGSYTLEIEAADRAGNVARKSVSFRLAARAPEISRVVPVSGTVLASKSVSISGECEEATSVAVAGVAASVYGRRFVAAGVPLAPGANTLSIVARDAAGNESQIALKLVRDDVAPRLSLSAPSAGLLTRGASVVVRGTASDEHLASVEINGAPARLLLLPAGEGGDGGSPPASFGVGRDPRSRVAKRPADRGEGRLSGSSFQADVRLAEGPNRLTVVARDAAGNRSEARVDIVRDSVAPVLSITYPGGQTLLAAPKADVSGEVMDAGLERVLVNGVPAVVDGHRFRASGVPLSPGVNRIAAVAVDRAGNRGEASVSVTRDDAALPLAVDLPASGALPAASMDLTGSVGTGGDSAVPAGVKLTINGVPAEVSGSRFRAPGLKLNEGVNTVTVRASDAAGRTGVATAVVSVTTRALELLTIAPADGTEELPVAVVARLTFSEPLDPATVNERTVRLTSEPGGEIVPASLFVHGREVALLPHAALSERAAYRLEVSDAIANLAGHRLRRAGTARFVTGRFSAPQTPELDAIPSALCAASVTISGKTDPGARVRIEGGAALVTAVTGSGGRFSAAVALQPESMSALSVVAVDAQSRVSEAVAGPVRNDCTPPRVKRASVEGGRLEVVFSEPIDPASLARDGAILLTQERIGVVPTPRFQLDATGRVARSEASEALREGRTTIKIGRGVTDLAGNALPAPFVTWASAAAATVGQAGLSGQVFDDRIGRPLTGAVVTVVAVDGSPPAPAAPSTTTGADGDFSLVVSSGEVALRAAREGYVGALRVGTAAAGDSLTVFDVRLTPETIVTAGSNGSASVADAGLALSLPASSVAANSTLRAASLAPQGLPALQPLGWSPAAALSLELGAATIDSPTPSTFPTAAAASWDNRFAYPTGTSLLLARFDSATRRYLSAGSASLSADGSKINAAIPGTGAFVVFAADPAPNTPPQPSVGQPLAGVAAPSTDPFLSATVSATPRDVLPTQTADIVATLSLSAPVPSGFPVEVLVSEALTLLDNQQIQVPSFLEDLTVLRDGTGQTIVPFRVRPSSTAAQVALSVGYENLTVKRYAFDLTRGNLIGTDGGTVTGPAGFSLVIPAGALPQTVAVTMTQVAAGDLPIPVPAGYLLLAAIDVRFGGQTLSQPAALKWAILSDPTGNGLIWVELAQVNGILRPLFVNPGRYDAANKLVETTPAAVNNLPVPGVLGGDIYLLLSADQPSAYVKGRVLDVDGVSPVASALVTRDGTTLVAASDGTGAYALPVPASGAVVRSSRLDTGNVGQATVGSQAPGAVATKDILLAVTAPYVLSIAPATSSPLPLDLPVVFTLSEPLNAATVTDSSVKALSGSTPIAGTVRLSRSGAQVTFTPTFSWPGRATVRLTLSSTVTDRQGYRLVNAASKTVADYVATYTTVDPTPPTDINPLLIYMTVPSGTPPTVTISGTAGAACATCVVTAVNDTTTVTSSTIALSDGSFTLRLAAKTTDRVYVAIRRPDSAEIRVDPGPYREDGGRVAYLGARAADYLTRDGIRVTIDQGSFALPATLSVSPIAQSALPAPVPALSTFVAGIAFDPGDAVADKPIDLSVAAPQGVTGGQFLVARAVEVAGQTRWMVIDTARYDNGAITTRPPVGSSLLTAAAERSAVLLSQAALVDCPQLANPGGSKDILDRVTRKSNIIILGVQQQVAFLASAVVMPNVAVSFTFSAQYEYLQAFVPYVWVAREAKQQCYFALPVPLGIPFGLLGRDAMTGLTIFQGNFSPVTDPGNITQLPPDALSGGLPQPRLTGGSPFTAYTFVPAPTAGVEKPFLSLMIYIYTVTGTSGTLTVKGSAGAVEASADLSLTNNVGAAAAVSGTAASDGSFTLTISASPGDDVTFVAGTKSLASDARIHLVFSQPLDLASVQQVTLNAGALAYDATPDSGSRGYTLVARQPFARGTLVTLQIPAGKLPKALTVKLRSPSTDVIGPRDVKDVNALYLKGDLLLEVTGTAGNPGDTTAEAKLNLYDATDPGAVVRCSSLPLYDFARGVTMDDHDRVLVAMGGGGTNGRAEVFRLSAPTGAGLCGGRTLIGEGSNPGDLDRAWTEVTVHTGAGDLGVLPEGFPRKLETLYRETRQQHVLDKDTTLPQFVTAIQKTDVSPADSKQDTNSPLTIVGQIPGSGVSPSPLNQPATLWNVTTGALWTSYADQGGNFTITGKASSGDRLEFRINAAEVAVVGTVDFGIQGVDINKTVHLSGQDCLAGGSPNDICDISKRLLFSFGGLTDLSPPLCRTYDGGGNCTDAFLRLDALRDLVLLEKPVAAAPGDLPAPADPAEPTVLAAINRFGLATFALTGDGENVRIIQLGAGVPVGTFDNPPIYPNFFAEAASRGFPVRPAGQRHFCSDARWKDTTGAPYRPTLAFLASSEGIFVLDVTKASVGGSGSLYPEPGVIGLFRLPSGSATSLSLDVSRGLLYVGSDGTSGQVSAYDMTDPCTLDLPGRVAPATDARRMASVDLPNENPNSAFVVDPDTGVVFGAGDSTSGGNGKAFALSLFPPPLRFVADTDHNGRWEQVGSIIPLGVPNPKKPAAPYAPDVVRILANIFGHAGTEIVVELSSTSASGVALSALPTGFPRTQTYVALKRQSDDPGDPGYNRYLSPPIVLVADPRARKDYTRTPEEEPARPPLVPTPWDDYACQNCKLDTDYAAELSTYAPDTEGLTRPQPVRAAIEHWAGEKLVVKLAEDASVENTLKTSATYLNAIDLKQVKAVIKTTRGDLTPALRQPPAQNPSFFTTEAGVAVATHSGAAQTAWTDLAIKGRGLDFALTRNYVSDVLHSGPFGRNLDSSLFARLRPLPTGDVDFYPGDGTRHTFRYDTAKKIFTGPSGVFLDLYRKDDLTFELIYPDQTRLFFDSDGRWPS